MSKIEWTEATWNPVAGCTIATAGCTNCYAMRMAARLDAMGNAKYAGLTRRSGCRHVWTGKVNLDRSSLVLPYRWKRPKIVFVNSMSDLFHPAVPETFIREVWKVMADTPQHTYQILTKRPERMAGVLTQPDFKVLKNVWLGTSVENSSVADRLDDLRRTPASVRFVSFEPLIGPVPQADLTEIHWAIVGGESGPKARPMEKQWVIEILQACREQGTAFFFKQWGGINKKKAGRELDGITFDEMPLAHAA